MKAQKIKMKGNQGPKGENEGNEGPKGQNERVVESLGGRLPDTIFSQNISSLHRGIFSPKIILTFLFPYFAPTNFTTTRGIFPQNIS